MSVVEAEKLGPSQAARRLGVSSQWVVELTKSGRLPCEMTPLGRLIPADAVEQMAAEREERRNGAAP